MSKIVKIGLWGGGGGQPRDIAHSPRRLERVEVSSGDAIYAIRFTYVDNSGNLHKEAWGGPSGNKIVLDLEDSEYVKEISGTYGRPWSCGPTVLTSLKFVTNMGNTQVHGRAGSSGSFHVPVSNGGQIAGFFARVGDAIDAIGVYVVP